MKKKHKIDVRIMWENLLADLVFNMFLHFFFEERRVFENILAQWMPGTTSWNEDGKDVQKIYLNGNLLFLHACNVHYDKIYEYLKN